MIVWEISDGRLDAAFTGALLASAGCDVYAEREEMDERNSHPPHSVDSIRPHLAPFLRKAKRELSFAEDGMPNNEIPRPDCIVVGSARADVVTRWLEFSHQSNAVLAFVSDFGITGPYSGRAASDLTLTHLGGVGYFIPGQVQNLLTDRPLSLPRDSVSYVTGLVAAGAVLAELFPRSLGDDYPPVVLDVSAHEAVASFTFGNISSVAYDGVGPSRGADARPSGWAVALFRCKDGHVCLVALEELQWQNWLHVLGDPDWGDLPLFTDREERSRNWDALQPLIETITLQIPTAELVSRAQSLRVPCTAVSTVKQLLTDPQLHARHFFEPLDSPECKSLLFPSLRQIWLASAEGAPAP